MFFFFFFFWGGGGTSPIPQNNDAVAYLMPNSHEIIFLQVLGTLPTLFMNVQNFKKDWLPGLIKYIRVGEDNTVRP